MKKDELLYRALATLSTEDKETYAEVFDGMNVRQLRAYIASFYSQQLPTETLPTQWPAMLARNGKELKEAEWMTLIRTGEFRHQLYIAQRKMNGIRLRLERRGDRVFAISRHREDATQIYIEGAYKYPN